MRAAIQHTPGKDNAHLAMQRTPGNATHAWRKPFALACNARLAAIPRTPCNTMHTWHATHAVHNTHAAHKRYTWRAARRCVWGTGEYRRGGYHRRVRNMHEKNRASRSRACDTAMLQRSAACCCCSAVRLCCNPYPYVATQRGMLLLQASTPMLQPVSLCCGAARPAAVATRRAAPAAPLGSHDIQRAFKCP